MNSATEEKNMEIDNRAYSRMLSDWKCPKCGNKVKLKEIGGKKRRHYCGNCDLFILLERPPGWSERKKQREARKKVNVFGREVAAIKSGGSQFPPLELHYYCSACRKKSLDDLEKRNKLAEEKGIGLSESTGDEGHAMILLNNRLIAGTEKIVSGSYHFFAAGRKVFPFTCNCGTRYHLNAGLVVIQPGGRYSVENGYHLTCFGCDYSHSREVAPDRMFFRCDKELDCQEIDKIKDRFKVEAETE